VPVAARQRLAEELGLRAADLRQLGIYLYRAGDARTGRVEHEYDHVLLAGVPAGAPMDADPAEVDDVRWVEVDQLRRDLDEYPARYAPWLAGVLSVWLQSMTEPAGGR
jgi:isopentenyl-diphosphate delta-isomerase